MKRIVLLPGYDGVGKKTYRKIEKDLEKIFEVRMVNYPYVGKWEKQCGVDDLIDCVDEVVGEEKVVLLGFSMGGFVASAYATKHPNKVSKLILVSSAVGPVLDKKLKSILTIAKLFLKNRLTAFWLTKIFLGSNLKDFPLPHPGKNFSPKQGFGVFGSLVRIMTEKSEFCYDGKKLAVLFEDDKSFPAKVYEPILKRQGFRVKIFETGGHAESVDYWEKVASAIKQ